MTVQQLLDNTSSAELTEWMAYAQLEPFGGDADYIGHAITAVTVANVNRPKNRRPYKVEDFLPKFGKTEQTVDEQIQFAAMVTASMGGQDMRPEEDED